MRSVLPVIVLAQFFCTSLWFAGNAILPDLAATLQAGPSFLGHLSSSVQLGFICGTFLFALLTVADRFPPSLVFLLAALLGAGVNLCLALPGLKEGEVLALRFATGFFLAGIYPVGMKIAADYYRAGLGRSLGLLVGALVLGTALPHLLKSLTASFPWRTVIYTTTALAVGGGLLLYRLVPDGPFRRPASRLELSALLQGFRHPPFRAAAFGYFGHMWELYTFWTFVPLLLTLYNLRNAASPLPVPLLSFLIIAIGAPACAISGRLTARFATKKLAAFFLALSGLCCLLSPLVLQAASAPFLILFFLVWGFAVIADSPLFSTLVAQEAPPQSRGTALTIVNCLGFALTAISIQVLTALMASVPSHLLFLFLVPGPALGLLALLRGSSQKQKAADQ